jgi:hypothetical protein
MAANSRTCILLWNSCAACASPSIATKPVSPPDSGSCDIVRAANGVAISGNTVVGGAPNESSSTTGVNGDQNNNNAFSAGAAYIFTIAGPSSLEQWRTLYFGSSANSGDGADEADPDFDGLVTAWNSPAAVTPPGPARR